MSTPIYLITLQGMGDTILKLINKESWDWMFTNDPTPDWMIQNYAANNKISYDEAFKDLQDDNFLVIDGSSSPDNDRAMNIPSSPINGEYFTAYSVSELAPFLKKHDLEVIEEYEGYIY